MQFILVIVNGNYTSPITITQTSIAVTITWVNCN